MTQQLRNLQLFRNDTIFVFNETINSVELLKDFVSQNVVLKDGEPISIRYKESENDEVKGLFGVCCKPSGTEQQTIVWGSENINIEGSEAEDIKIEVTEEPTGTFTISGSLNDGVVEGVINTQLEEGGSIKEAIDTAVEGIEIPVYTGSNSIDVSDSNVISVKVKEDENNAIVVDENGVFVQKVENTDTTYEGSSSINITGESNTISVKISDHAGNILNVDDNGLWAVLGASVTITDVKVFENNTESTKYFKVNENGLITEFEPESTEGVMSVEAHEKKLMIATSDGHLYGSILPETDETFVTSGEIKQIAETETETAKTVIEFSYNIEKDPFTVDITELVVANAVATTENDVMTVTTEGKFNQKVMEEIENYIDNYDCGTFSLTLNTNNENE